MASLANLGKDTIRKIEQIEEVAAPEVKALAAAGDVSINLASQFVSLPEEVQQEAIAAKAKSNQGARTDILPTLAEGFKPVDTREEVSKRAGISHGSLDKVEAIKAANPEPEILEAVRTGEVSINLAAQFVALPEEVQQEAIAAIAENHEPAKEVMREAVHNHRAQGTRRQKWLHGGYMDCVAMKINPKLIACYALV